MHFDSFEDIISLPYAHRNAKAFCIKLIEKISAIVEIENKKAIPCTNGTTWEDTFERIWSLKCTPDNRLACAVLRDYEWTVAIDQNPGRKI